MFNVHNVHYHVHVHPNICLLYNKYSTVNYMSVTRFISECHTLNFMISINVPL